MLKREKQIRVWQSLKYQQPKFSLVQSMSEFTVNFVCILQNGAGFFFTWQFLWVFPINTKYEKWEHACESENFGRRYIWFSMRGVIKVSESRKQFMVSSILPKNERNSLSWASSLLRIVSFVRFLGELRTP